MNYLIVSTILVSVLLSVLAQIFLKHAMSNVALPESWLSVNAVQLFVNKYLLLGLSCYGLSMMFWLYVLTKVEVSRAYPFVGLGFIGTMLFAYYFLNEPITLQKLMGTLLVVAGVILIAK